MLFPIMVWAGFRVGRWGVAVACAATCYAASWLTAHGFGPLAASVVPNGGLILQIYFISLMLCGLCVAAAVHQYELKARQLREAREGLEEAVRQRTALLADAERVAGLGSWRWEIQSDVVQWSDELLELTGMEQSPDMTLREFLDLVVGDDRARVRLAIERALTGETFDVEFNIMRPDGETLRLASRARVFFESGDLRRPAQMVGTAQDVTDKRKAELVLGLVDSLNEKERLRKEFVANVSHELRTPLASVVGYTETLLNGALDDKAVLREFLEAIHRNSSWLWRLVEDLLDLASLDAGKSKPKPEPLVLGEAVETVFGIVRELAGKQGVSLEAGGGLQACVMADGVHLRRILQNALDNAIKFSEADSRIVVCAEAVEERVTLIVRDQGCGIAATDLPSLFERFHRAPSSIEKKGTGLGLTLIKELAEANGGGVRLESALGQGTSLFVTLPAAVKVLG
jgi:PAS domain S-box-containing protein